MFQSKNFPVACLAPTLDDDKLAVYSSVVSAIGDPETKEAAAECLNAVKMWWDLPESKKVASRKVEVRHHGEPHTIDVVPMEDEHVKALWDAVPWMSECDRMKVLFDKLPLGEVRDVCHHLLWFCIELTQDREPITQDKIRKA